MTSRSVTNERKKRPRIRRRRKEQRPGEILDAALRIFAQSGFAGTKLDDVAAAAGIGKGTIYLYFETKEDLFRAVVRQLFLSNFETLRQLVPVEGSSAHAILRRFAERLLTVIESDLGAVIKIVVTESEAFPWIAEFYVREVAGQILPWIESVIAMGIERGEFRRVDPHSVVPLWGAPFLALTILTQTIGRQKALPFEPRTVIDAHVDMFLRGLRPGPLH
ncbi:MAG TPA: TetR/AcrR family transcriptional regulator [Candidatus Cybelea sp.]|jgi:AcrR family transcriptional regulator